MMLLIVLVRVQDSRCMGLGSVSWDLLIPSGVRLLVVVVWPIVCDMPIYDGFLDMYMFCILHVLYIQGLQWNDIGLRSDRKWQDVYHARSGRLEDGWQQGQRNDFWE
jgi:hypothetical protein